MELVPPAVAAVLDLAARQRLVVEFEQHPLSEISDTWNSASRLVYLP
jgi:hypothetical protein